jgi:hypothetical protein
MKVLFLIAVCAALFVAYAIGFAAPGFDVYHDDGIYLVTAKALADGSGYKIISLPEPIAQTRYPPMFPLALAAVWKAFPRFPHNIYALKIVPFGFAVAWMWLVFVYLREKFGAVEPAVWIVILSVASPWVLFSSVAFMSETTFAFFLTATFLVIDRMNPRNDVTWSKVLLASALAACAILTRTAGLPLILAGSGVFLARKKISAAVAYFFIVAALVSPWWIWSSRHGKVQASVDAYYGGSIYANLSLLSAFAWSQRLHVMAINIANAIISPGALMGVSLTSLGFLLCLILAAFALYGFVLDLRNGITSLNLCVLLYEGMLLLWPWPSIRFQGPLLPFLLYFAYLGVVELLGKITEFRIPSRIGAALCAVSLILFAGHALFLETQATLRNGTARFPLEEQKNWPATVTAMRWVSQNTPTDAVLLGEDPTIFLLTGRRAIGLFSFDPFEFSYAPNREFPLGTPSQFITGLLQAKVDYAMYASDSRGTQSRLAREQIEKAVSDHPAAFAKMSGTDVPNYVIYSVNRLELEAETK